MPDHIHGSHRRREALIGCLLALMVSLLAAGCASSGPIVIPGDHFNYNKAGAQAAKEQLLLNIVRLRYREPIYVLEIGSMISSHTLVANGSYSGWSNNLNELENPALMAIYGNDKHASQQRAWSAGVGYTDSPTITYTPVQGEKFAGRMMTPIPETTVFQLCQSGWGIDQLLQCCVQWINGIPNSSRVEFRESRRRPDPRFNRVATLMREMQDAGELVFEFETTPDSGKAQYLRAIPDHREMEEERRELRELLGYPEGPVTSLRLVAAPFKAGPEELAMQTRSLLAMMSSLARGVTVPDEHVKRGWADNIEDQGEGEEQEKGWLCVGCSVLPRSDAFVQVWYKGHWFFVEESDARSKRTLALLDYLFSLQETEKEPEKPVVTVPAK